MKKEKTPPCATQGFTIIEAIVSLLLVFLALLIMTRITAAAIEAYRKTRAGFYLLQQMEAYKDCMQGKPFDSTDWLEGATIKTITPFKIELEVQRIGPGLKIARLTFAHAERYIKARTQFYKSQYITNRSKNNQ